MERCFKKSFYIGAFVEELVGFLQFSELDGTNILSARRPGIQ